MRTSSETYRVPEAREGETQDVTRFLGKLTIETLAKVRNVLPGMSNMKKSGSRQGVQDAIESALSIAAALKNGMQGFAEKGMKLPPLAKAKDRSTLLNGMKEPILAGIVFMNALAGASPAEAKSMKAQVAEQTKAQHELIVDMKNDPRIGQFIPEKKPFEEILYGADENYPQLKAWMAKHPNVKRIEVSEFRAAIQHTHDDAKKMHTTEAQATLTVRIFLKNGTHKTITVKGTGQGLPSSLNYYSMELNQKIGEFLGATKIIPDVHKQKSPFYDKNDDYMGAFIGMRFAKQDAVKKLFRELDAAASEAEPRKSK